MMPTTEGIPMVQGLTENELIARSSCGDRLAQAAMVQVCITKQFSGLSPFESGAFAEVFARQAAAHGFLDDRLRLSAVLRIRAHHVAELDGGLKRAGVLWREAVSLCDDLTGLVHSDAAEFLAGVLTSEAEMGSEEAEALLDRITQTLTAGEADTLRTNINRAVREFAAEQCEMAQ